MAGYKRYDKHREISRIEFALECRKFNHDWKSTLWSDGTREVWLAKSQAWASDGRQGIDVPAVGTTYTVSVPEWLAKAEGLI